jgi:multidrug efflux pump subunit AcrA (membrane-fusion protein)
MGQLYPLLLASALLLSLQPAFIGTAQKPLRSVQPRPANTTKSTAESLSSQGVVEPICVVPLLTTTHGWVRQVFFVDGDYVRRHQILLKFMYNDVYSSQFNRNYVLAPRNGFIEHNNVTVGSHVKKGAQVATLLDVSQVKVVVKVPAPTARNLRLCDQVPVQIAELPTRRFTGIIDHILRPTPTRPTYQLTVTVRNTISPLIRPRMHARVLWPARQAPAVVANR